MNLRNITKWDARLIYYILVGGQAFLFRLIFTVNMVYQAEAVGLNALQLVLVGTMLEVGVFLFEVPTGVVADVYSRRLSIIIGVFLIGLGFVVEGSVPVFGAILFAQLLWGVGFTFTSGATEAWIVDEIGEAHTGHIFLRGSQVGQVCSLIAIPLAVLLGALRINLPIVLGGAALIVLGVFLLLFMPETGFHPTPRGERTTWQSMWHTFGAGLRLVRVRPVLLAIMGVGLLYGLYSEGFDRLWTPHLLDNFVVPWLADVPSVVWFGVIGALSSLLALGATEIARRSIGEDNPNGAGRLLLICTGLMIVILAGFALALEFPLAVAALLAFNTLRAVTGPLFSTWSNHHIDSRVRATVLSMFGQIDAIGQIAGGPPVGWVGITFGVRAALLTSAAILSPALLFILRAMRLGRQGQPATQYEAAA